MAQEANQFGGKKRLSRGQRIWLWVIAPVLIAGTALAVIAAIMVRRAIPILKGRVIETLSTRFDSRVELDGFHVTVAKGLDVSGDGLRIFPPDDVVAAGAKDPLISLGHFSFHANLPGLFIKPMHVGTVYVKDMEIHVPPREMRAQAAQKRRLGKIKIVVEEIVLDNSRLILGTENPNKDPQDFELKHVEMRDVGPKSPWLYNATLINSVPVGEIHSTGMFGPWVNESPGDSSVTGHYTFEHADLNTIKGIGGMLSSVGDFKGQLDRIEVDGTTDTPDFSVDTANHPMPLHTRFHAIVDGTNGDTYLRPVEAKLGESEFTCSGAVINVRGKGHIIDLNTEVPHGRIQDFLELGVKTEPVVMTGTLAMKARLRIDPGKESVSRKMGLRGRFLLSGIHFTNPKWEDKVDMLSLRTSGKPGEAKPGAPDVHSRMAGQFVMKEGKVSFSRLRYTLPGATVDLKGVYSLDGQEFDFAGHVKTEARLSQMTSSWWKSLLLKPVDPFFAKDGSGAVIPVKVTGTQSDVKFGLNLHR